MQANIKQPSKPRQIDEQAVYRARELADSSVFAIFRRLPTGSRLPLAGGLRNTGGGMPISVVPGAPVRLTQGEGEDRLSRLLAAAFLRARAAEDGRQAIVPLVAGELEYPFAGPLERDHQRPRA